MNDHALNKQGSLSLAAGGDQLLVYTGTRSSPSFVFGFSSSPWVTDGSTAITSTNSICPAELMTGSEVSEVSLGKVDNAGYSGATSGSSGDILALVSNSSNWLTRYSFDDL